MAISDQFDTKTIDELQELGKLTGDEKILVSYKEGEENRKVTIDTIVGYAASLLQNIPTTLSLRTGIDQCIIFVPEGEDMPLSQRTPGCFYLEERNQTSIRTKINIPTSVKVSSNLGLRRV